MGRWTVQRLPRAGLRVPVRRQRRAQRDRAARRAASRPTRPTAGRWRCRARACDANAVERPGAGRRSPFTRACRELALLFSRRQARGRLERRRRCCGRRPSSTSRTGPQLPPQLFSHNDMQGHWLTSHAAGADDDRLGRAPRRRAPVRQHRPAVGGRSPRRTPTSSSRARRPSSHQVRSVQPARPDRQRRCARTATTTRPPIRRRVFESAITMARVESARGPVRRHRRRDALQLNDFVLNAALLRTGRQRHDTSRRVSDRHAVPGQTSNPLAAQLRSVAMMIAARQALGVKRQVFFVSLGGFDTPQRPVRRRGRHRRLAVAPARALGASTGATR